MGPLQGLKIIEVSGLGPGPFCGMLLADLGADVVCVTWIGGTYADRAGHRLPRRGKRSVIPGPENASGPVTVFCICYEKADAVFEGFRPGVMEKLGLGPEACMAVNPAPRLRAYDRLGTGRTAGPVLPGHDINYISLTGALAAIGRKGRETGDCR